MMIALCFDCGMGNSASAIVIVQADNRMFLCITEHYYALLISYNTLQRFVIAVIFSLSAVKVVATGVTRGLSAGLMNF